MTTDKLMMLAGSLFMAGFAMAGNVWYVDAVNGNDGWDGTTAEIPSSGTVGPRKTLVKVMELASAGDTIYAAEGDYDSGEILADGNATSNRVIVKAGALLAASGRRANTFISGRLSDSSGHSGGNHANAVRAIFFATPTAEETSAGFAGGVVKGFTIRKGRTSRDTANENNRCGGGVFGPGLVVDCDFADNGSDYRGPNVSGGATVLRCRLGERTNGSYELYKGCQACDTLFETTVKTYPNINEAKIVNCTFTNAAPFYCNVYNCLFLDPDNGTSQISKSGTYYNSYSRGAQGDGTTNAIVDKDGNCQFGLAAGQLPNVELNTRPLSGSEVIDAGNVGYYNDFTNGWTVGWIAHWTGRDYVGSERIHGGSIDVGCCEWIADELAMHVDAVNGDDVNTGLSELQPKRTLAAAVEAATADPRLGISLVKAAAGTYAEGSMSAGDDGPARVVIPDGIKLEGAGADVTFIEGAQATYPIKDGCGTNSLRCAFLANSAILKGFTLRNGYAWNTVVGEETWKNAGGGSKGNGLVVDCVYSNNTTCYRGGDASSGTFIRCYFGAAKFKKYNVALYQKMADCVFDVGADEEVYAASSDSKIFNCTFVTGCPSTSGSYVPNVYNSLILNSGGTMSAKGAHKFYSCRSSKPCPTDAAYESGDLNNLFDISLARLRMDYTTYRPRGSSLACDAGDGVGGTANYRALITEGWSEAWIAELGDRDFAGGERVINDRVDVGAGEFMTSGFVITFK